MPPVAAEVLAVRDLELVDPARWPQALDLLAAPPLRAALVEPTRVLLADGRHADVPSYTAWWLRHHPVLGGHRPADVRVADADPLLAGLYDEADLPADPAVARALGVRTSLAELLAEPGGADELLDRLADPARPVTRAQLRPCGPALAAVAEARAARPGARGTRGRRWSWPTPRTSWCSTPRTCGRWWPPSRWCWRPYDRACAAR